MQYFRDLILLLFLINILAVHSSGSIRSVTTNDSPYQCGAVLCRPISETFSKTNIPHGYLYLTTIGTGASNISIMQMDHSKNLLVLKAAEEDHFIINGNEQPSTNGIYKYYGNLFEYKKGEDYEVITASGPISKPVDFLILVKGPNPGIQYEYFLPVASSGVSDADEAAVSWNEQGTPLDYSDEVNKADETTTNQPVERRKKKFIWKLIGFGACSKSCGGGMQAPIFRCIRDSPTRFYSPRRCMHVEKPVFNEIIYKCNTQACPAYWHTEEWDDCYCRLGKGTHSRNIKCVQELHGGVAIQVDDAACIEDKPPTREYCPCPRRKITARSNKSNIYENLRGSTHSITVHNHKNLTNNKLDRGGQKSFREDKNDKTGMWLMSDWNQYCSAQCGYGTEHRSIFCDRTPPYTDRCDLRITPDTSRSCQSEQTCNYGIWFTSKWGECRGDCFNLMRNREVACIKDNIVVEDEECLLDKRPESKELCSLDEVDYCKARWHYSEWTECSKECGGGTQKRFAKCLEIDPKENVLKESSNCRYVDRQPVYSTCKTDKCTDNDSEIENNELPPSCVDVFPNCHLITNKEKYCTLNYYKKNCCKACNNY